MRKILVSLIRFYQATLSPDHGLLKPLFPFGLCRHRPTCSEFCLLRLERSGIRALPECLKRLLSCQPWLGRA